MQYYLLAVAIIFKAFYVSCLQCMFRIAHYRIFGDNIISCPLPPKPVFLGHASGRVFPTGVGLGSPSRHATNWLSSRFSPSIETWRRFGWLRMMFTSCASSELKLGALREVVADDR